MQPPITTAAGYASQRSWGAPTLERGQNRLLTLSFVWTSVGFLLTFGLTYAFYYLLQAVDPTRAATGVLIVLAPLLLIGCMFMGMFARPKYSGKPVFLQFVFWTFVLVQGLALGALLYAVSYYDVIGLAQQGRAPLNLVDVGSAFGVGGAMFAAMAAVGHSLSARGAMRLGKLLMVATFAFLALYLVLSLALIFGRGGWTSTSWVTLVILGLSGLLCLGYIAYAVSSIRQSEAFVSAAGNEALLRSSALFYGYFMLVNLMGVVRVIIGLMIRIRA